MVKQRIDENVQKRMWEAVLKSAMRYHNRDVERGMGKLIAYDADVTRQSVSDWKRGKNYPAEKTLRRLAGKYGVSVEYIAGFSRTTDDYPPVDEQILKAYDLLEEVLAQVLPDASPSETIHASKKAVQLFLDGNEESKAFHELFQEVVRMKNERGDSD